MNRKAINEMVRAEIERICKEKAEARIKIVTGVMKALKITTGKCSGTLHRRDNHKYKKLDTQMLVR